MKKLLFLSLLLSYFQVYGLPLKPDSELEFAVDEVTWLSVDLAPDDSRFIIEVLGDLYFLPLAGGVAEPLREGVEFDSQPAFSPDGELIAFISDASGNEDLWVVNVDGTSARKITDANDRAEFASPTWSPDGDHIIVSRTTWGLRTFELWAYHLDGGAGVRITQAKFNEGTPASARNNALGAVYSPDGRYVYFAHKQGGFGYNLTLPLWQIVRRELPTQRDDTITSAVGSAFRPILSPDGELLVYGTRFDTQTGLRMRNLRTGHDDWLVYPVQRDDQESRYTRDVLPGYTFDSTGSKVYFTANGKLLSIDVNSKQLGEVPFEVPVKLKVNTRLEFPYRLGMGPVKAQLIRDVELSPDNRKIVFSTLGVIYVHDLVARTIKALTEDDVVASQPTWSPNGKTIAFVGWHDAISHIWRANANGRGDPRRITKIDAYYSDPIWTKDGARIVALRGSSYERGYFVSSWGPGSNTDLVSVVVKTGEVDLIRHAGSMFSPHWGPETDRLYVYRSPGFFGAGDSGLTSMQLDGTDLVDHLSMKGAGIYNSESDVPVADMQISPDGKFVLVLHANQLYIVKLLNTHVRDLETSISNSSLPLNKLTDIGADHFGWSKDGSAVYWSVGHDFFKRPVDSIDFKETDEAEEKDTAKNKETEKSSDDATTEISEDHAAVERNSVEVYFERFHPNGMVALVGGTVVDMVGEEPILQVNATVLIEGSRIVSIGSVEDIPEAATRIDISGKFVLPGFIDTHAHFPIYRRSTINSSWSLRANLAYGVTTGIDVQPSTVDIVEYRDMVNAGKVLGTRPLSTGPGIFNNNEFKSEKHAKEILQRYKNHYGVRNLKAYISGSREQRHWLVKAARELKLMPTTEGALDLKLDLTHAIDGFTGNEHNLPVIGLYDDVAILMGRTRIAYTPTLLVSYGGPFGESYFYTRHSPRGDEKLSRFTPPVILEQVTLRQPWAHKDVHVFGRHAAQALKIVNAGGRVGVGAHGQLQGLGYHWEMWALSEGGFDNFEVLRAATRHGAEMIGVSEDIGTVEAGKLADLMVLSSNPLDDIHNTTSLHYVIKGGVVYDAATLEEVWPQKRELPRPYWLDQIPQSSFE